MNDNNVTDPDGLPGLRLETASSVIAKQIMHEHLSRFAAVIRNDRHAGQSTATAYASGLAGVIALVIAGGHGSKDEVLEQMVTKLREYVARDLAHLRKI